MIYKGKKIGLLIVILLVLLTAAGCNGEQETKSSEANSDIYEITVENITLTGKNTADAEIEKLANEIIQPAINCRIKLIDVPISEHEDTLKKVQAGMEEIDLISAGLTASLSVLASAGTLAPLEELLPEYAPELKQKVERLLQGTTINGHVYAIPANIYCGRAEGIGYNADIAEECGIKVPEKVNLEVLTEIGRELKEQGSGYYLTTQGDGSLTAFSSFYDLETFGGDFSYGIIFNPLENTKIVNVYESEEYRAYCKVLQQWREAGYIPSDSLTNGRNSQDMFNSGESFFQFSSVSPGTYLATVGKKLGFREEFAAITKNRITTDLVQEFTWAISSKCEHPEKAMELLNLIYTNADLANLLNYGREEIEYTKTGEESILPIETDTGYSSYFTIYGDSAQMYYYDSDYDITNEDMKEFSKQVEIGKTFGYVFRTDNVIYQVQNVNKVVNEYRPVLETGMAEDSDKLLDEFIAALKKAGIDEVIAENQRQLDEWLLGQQ